MANKIGEPWVFGVIGKARKLIGVKKRWCKGALARTKTGAETEPLHVSANRWCAVGAVMKSCGHGDNWAETHRKVCRAIVGEADFFSYSIKLLANINDGPDGYRKVLKLFDSALKMRPRKRSNNPKNAK